MSYVIPIGKEALKKVKISTDVNLEVRVKLESERFERLLPKCEALWDIPYPKLKMKEVLDDVSGRIKKKS